MHFLLLFYVIKYYIFFERKWYKNNDNRAHF